MVTITDKDGGASVTAQGTATVADAKLDALDQPNFTQPPLLAVEGNTFIGAVIDGVPDVLAIFSDENPGGTPNDFNLQNLPSNILPAAPSSPTIAWGDGKTTLGTVVADPTRPGVFLVTGTHLYVDETTKPGDTPNVLVVTIADEGGSTLTIRNNVPVADAALIVTLPRSHPPRASRSVASSRHSPTKIRSPP